MMKYAKYFLIAGLASLLFLPFLGQVHLFDWDEVNFAECAREMIVSKDYLRAQIDFMPFWEKPPFFIWMQVISMKIFGVGEYAARLPNALTGVLTLTTLFYIGKRVASEKMAAWWVLLYAATWLPHFYFKTGIIDPVFNFFIFVAFFQSYLLRVSPRKGMHAALAGLFLGLAVLTKGPAAILIALLSFAVYIILNRGMAGYKLKHLLLIALFASIPMLAWMGAAIATHGMVYGRWFITEFVSYQLQLFSTEDSDHGGPFYYHFIVLLIGCFPASAFLFQYGRKSNAEKQPGSDFARWMWILFWVVLILFSIVKTKIIHYSSLCYFPLTFLAALQLYRLGSEPLKVKSLVSWVLLLTGTILGVLILSLPLAGIYKDKLIPLIHDPFAAANLGADVMWSFAECAWGAIYILGVWVAVFMMKKDFRRGMMLLCITQVVIIQVTVLHFTPKIEKYTQGAAISYFTGFKGRNVYVQPLGYKSYANLFYTDKLPAQDTNYHALRTDFKGRKAKPVANEHWLIYGKTDRPVYFLCKVQDTAKYVHLPQVVKTGERNGFVFLKRAANGN